MKDVDYLSVAEKAVAQIKKGAFLTVQADTKLNTMTIGWATIGFVWQKPIFMVAVRNSRYTFGLIEEATDFSVSVPSGDLREALMYCGTKSGSVVDKFHECRLQITPGRKIHSPVIQTPGLHFENKIIFKAPMDSRYLASECKGLYPEKDYHTLYFGEIMACYEM
jgi:flavin reductase (DIM6/NTAB) family NADH-FMN oxidoreductase RutF